MDYMENMQQITGQPEAEEPYDPVGEAAPDPVGDAPYDREDTQDGQQARPRRSVRRKKTQQEEQLESPGDGELSETQPQQDAEDAPPDSLYDPDEEETPTPQDTEQGELTGSDDALDGEAERPRRRRPTRRVVLDSAGNAIREQPMSGSLHDISILTAARNARRILTARVDAIETDGDALPRVVFYVGEVKVMIPFDQMGLDLDPEEISQREARMLINFMMGAKIDYMVRGVDMEAKIVAASRRDAMLVRQRTILNARGINREYRIEEGMRVMARVVYVSQYGVRVEIYGFEVYIRIGDISNLWVKDVREVIHVGEERPVEITGLTRDEDGRVVFMRASMRAAEDIPHLELREGNTYTGHINGFSETAYFVRVVGVPTDVRCPVKSNHTMEPLGVGDYVKFYVRGIHDGVPTGAILKVLKKQVVSDF